MTIQFNDDAIDVIGKAIDLGQDKPLHRRRLIGQVARRALAISIALCMVAFNWGRRFVPQYYPLPAFFSLFQRLVLDMPSLLAASALLPWVSASTREIMLDSSSPFA